MFAAGFQPVSLGQQLVRHKVFGVHFKFGMGGKRDQASSNRTEGAIIAILRDHAGDLRYALATSGHRIMQIASEPSVVARDGLVI